jgi:hypothetical protein
MGRPADHQQVDVGSHLVRGSSDVHRLGRHPGGQPFGDGLRDLPGIAEHGLHNQ